MGGGEESGARRKVRGRRRGGGGKGGRGMSEIKRTFVSSSGLTVSPCGC